MIELILFKKMGIVLLSDNSLFCVLLGETGTACGFYCYYYLNYVGMRLIKSLVYLRGFVVAVECVVGLCLLCRFDDGTWIDHDVAVIFVQTLVIDPTMYSIGCHDILYLENPNKKIK